MSKIPPPPPSKIPPPLPPPPPPPKLPNIADYITAFNKPLTEAEKTCWSAEITQLTLNGVLPQEIYRALCRHIESLPVAAPVKNRPSAKLPESLLSKPKPLVATTTVFPHAMPLHEYEHFKKNAYSKENNGLPVLLYVALFIIACIVVALYCQQYSQHVLSKTEAGDPPPVAQADPNQVNTKESEEEENKVAEIGNLPPIVQTEPNQINTKEPEEENNVAEDKSKSVPFPEFQLPQNLWFSQDEFASAPADFRRKVKEIADEIKSKGGFAVAGQVVEKEGTPLKKGTYTVTLKYQSNAQDTYRFENGWFITKRQTDSNYTKIDPNNNKIVASSFQHNEVEVPVQIEDGKVNFQQVFFERIPKSKLTTLKGIVLNEKGQPVPNAQVTLTIDRASGYFEFNARCQTSTVTDSKGQYSFSEIMPQAYGLAVPDKPNSHSYTSCKVLPGNDNQNWVMERSLGGLFRQEQEKIVSTVLFPRRVIIDSVYQPDGSTDFSKGNVLKNQYTLDTSYNIIAGRNNIKTGRLISTGGLISFESRGTDLRLSVNNEGKCLFSIYMGGGISAHYDLGEVDFDSVKGVEPDKFKYNTSCELNHVYVVRTYPNGHYAKFIVRSIEVVEPPKNAEGEVEDKQFEKSTRRSLGADLKLYGKNIDDSDFDWEALRGKYVVVKFTATWCGPCRGEIPGLIRAYEKYHDKGLEIVSVYIWENGTDYDKLNDTIKGFSEKEKVNWQIISEPLTLKAGGEKIGAFYGISGVPTMLLIDKDGKIIDTAARGQHLQDRLAEIFDGVVNEKSELERKNTQKQPKPSAKSRSSQNSWPSQKDLAAAPADFYKKGKEIADEIKAKGGFAVAGQVIEDRGMPLKKGTYTVALKYQRNAQDTYRFENGWFITRTQTNPSYNKIIVASFQHNEVEVPVQIEQGKVNFQQVFLERIPKAKLVTLKGIVQNEKDRPVPNAQVTLTIDRSNGYFNSPTSINTVTDSKGWYSFSEIPFQEYSLSIKSQAYRLDTSSVQNSYSYTSCKVQPGNDKQSWGMESYDGLSRQEDGRIVSTILLPRRVIIDSIYQPDGSTDFSKGNVLKNRYALELFGRHGTAMGTQKIGNSIIFDPIAEKSNWGYYESDLILLVLGGKCTFRHTYTNGKVGHYDLGEVDFDLVKNAAPEKIRGGDSPCELNHVYVVKTYQKGHYAKFIVRSIEIMEPPNKK